MAGRTTSSIEDRVAQVLLAGGFITNQQLEQARGIGKVNGMGLLDALVSYGMVAQETLVTVVSFQLKIPVVDLRDLEVCSQCGNTEFHLSFPKFHAEGAVLGTPVLGDVHAGLGLDSGDLRSQKPQPTSRRCR